MTEQFKRDMGRYIVIKSSDMKVLHPTTVAELYRAVAMTNTLREMSDKPPLECVVVESDWPEYERVWAMIEARVTGCQRPDGISDADINDITLETLGKWPSFEAQSWACKVAHKVLQQRLLPFPCPDGYGALGWFLAARDHACDNQIDNIVLPRGLVTIIAEHISQLESQLEKSTAKDVLTMGKHVHQLAESLPNILGQRGTLTVAVSPAVQDELRQWAEQLSSSGPITEDELNDCLGFPLPEWAVDVSDGTLKPGLQLCTKDGRRCGNAHIIGFERVPGPGAQFFEVFTLLTDAGNRIRATEQEIDELFHRGEFVSDPAEVISRFGGKDETE